jgi:hypothetical protein
MVDVRRQALHHDPFDRRRQEAAVFVKRGSVGPRQLGEMLRPSDRLP